MATEKLTNELVEAAEAVYQIRQEVFYDPNKVHRKLIQLGWALKRYKGQLPPDFLREKDGHNETRNK